MKDGETMNTELDIDEIMQQIRSNIRERGYAQDPVSFENIQLSDPAQGAVDHFDRDSFSGDVDYLNYNWNNPLNIPTGSGRSVSGGIKRLILRCAHFIVFPIVNYQNAYNAGNARCLNQVRAYMDEMETYKKRIEQLEQEIEALKREQAQ